MIFTIDHIRFLAGRKDPYSLPSQEEFEEKALQFVHLFGLMTESRILGLHQEEIEIETDLWSIYRNEWICGRRLERRQFYDLFHQIYRKGVLSHQPSKKLVEAIEHFQAATFNGEYFEYEPAK